MTIQEVAECPKCGCDAMAETRTLKPSDLPALDDLDRTPPRVVTKRVFTCSNCGTKFKRSGEPEGQVRKNRPRTICPKCGCTRMWDSFQEEKYPGTPVYGIRYIKTPGDSIWVHVCSKCGKRFEQLS